MATLLARLARANARNRCIRTPHSIPTASSSRIGASHAQAWRTTGVSIDFKSFSTGLGIEKTSDTLTEDSSSNGETEMTSSCDPRESFRSSVLKKTQWIEKLAKRKAFDMILRAVHECYRPLYQTHSGLRGVKCSLWESYDDAEAVAMEKMRYLQKSYNDPATRSIEVKAMEVFLARKRPDLAIAVYDHRKSIAARLGTMKDKKSGYVTDFSKHYKSFSLAAMTAFRKLGDNNKAVAVYVDALETGSEPLAAMTAVCLKALLAIGDQDSVRTLYDVVKDSKRPVDYQFYKHMMAYASSVKDTELMQEVMHAMEAEKVQLRSEDYFSAIRSLDGQYFQVDTTQGEDAATKSTPESYQDCLDRINAQAASPEAHTRVCEASKRVLSTFDEMIDVAKIVPHQKAFFPRVMRAAMHLQDYERVTKYADQYEQVFGKPITGNMSLAMATNALLLQQQPVAAWEFVIKAFQAAKEEANELIVASPGVLTSLSSILQYLDSAQDLELTCQFLDALKAKMLLFLLKRDQRCSLIEAVVSNTEHVSDSTVLDMIRRYGVAFSVRNKVQSLKDFAKACVKAERWSLLLQVLKSRDEKRLRSIPGWLAVPISEAAREDVLSLERMELVAEVSRMVDLAELEEPERVILSRNASLAVQSLHDFHGGAGMRMSQYYQRQCRRLVECSVVDRPNVTAPTIVERGVDKRVDGDHNREAHVA